MWVKKIIYVTPGESKHSELTSMAESQLKEIAKNVLEWEDISKFSKVFRATKEVSGSISDSLLYLSNKCNKVTQNSWESLYHNLISNPEDIEEIINSTREGEAIVVGITQKELKSILEILKKDWYEEIDKDKINRGYNIYAATIDLDNKKSNFFESQWGKQ